MSDIVERVAEAIWRADHRTGEPEHWVACAYPNYYRMLARAAVDALQLTEERRTNVMSSGGMTTNTKTGVTTAHSDMRYDTRLVSPWQAEESK